MYPGLAGEQKEKLEAAAAAAEAANEEATKEPNMYEDYPKDVYGSQDEFEFFAYSKPRV